MPEQQLGVGADVHHHGQPILVGQSDGEQAGRGVGAVEVADEARALEIAALVSAVPGKDGVPTQQPIHVRQVMDDGPADAAEMDDYLSSAQGS